MTTDIETDISNFIEENNPIDIKDNDGLSRATICVKNIKAMQDKVKSSFDPIVDQAHKAHKEAIGQRDKYLKPLQDIEKKFKEAILVFSRKMEEEQKERIRLANERLKKQAEENKQKLLDEAKKTDDAWDKEELQEKAQSIVAVTCDAPGKAIEQDGLSIRKTWKARIVDERIIPRQFLIVNVSALNEAAKQEEYRISGISGVEFYQQESASVR